MVVSHDSWLARAILAAVLGGSAPIGAEEPVHRAEDIVVEEQTLRPAEVFQDRPIETEILTEEEIRSLPAQNAAEVVDQLPGIRTQQRVQGEDAAVSIEGMPPEYTKILVDGQRYAGEIGAVTDLADIPIANVERIEILRGSQGLRYGTEAAGGVINLVTKDPPREGGRASLEGGYGQDKRVVGRATVGWGGETLGASLWVDHGQIDGYEPPEDVDAVFVGAGRGSRTMTDDVNAKIVARPRENLTLRTRMGWRREDDDLVGIGENGIVGGDGIDASREEQRWFVSQEAEGFVGDATRIVGALTWYDSRLESEVGRTFRLDEDEAKLDLAVDHFFATGPVQHAVTFGVDARLDRLQLDEGGLPPGIDNPALRTDAVEERFTKTGLFLIGETELVDWAALHWGVRAQLHSEFDTEILPQVALLLTPFAQMEGWGDLKIRLSWGRNHRTPSLRDLFQPPVAQLGGAYFLAGNETLTSESSTSWRAGFEYSPFRWMAVSAVGFWNDIDDHIRSTFSGSLPVGTREEVVEVPAARPGLDLICSVTGFFFPECAALGATVRQTVLVERTAPLFRKTNLDSVRTRGVEARLDLRPWPFFALHLGYTFLDTEVLDSNLIDLDELPNEPAHTVDARVVLTAPRTATQLTVRGRWRDRAVSETSGTGLLGFASPALTDPSLVIDARLTQPVGRLFGRERDAIQIYTDVYNATNEEAVDSNAIRGRTVFVGVRMAFQ